MRCTGKNYHDRLDPAKEAVEIAEEIIQESQFLDNKWNSVMYDREYAPYLELWLLEHLDLHFRSVEYDTLVPGSRTLYMTIARKDEPNIEYKVRMEQRDLINQEARTDRAGNLVKNSLQHAVFVATHNKHVIPYFDKKETSKPNLRHIINWIMGLAQPVENLHTPDETLTDNGIMMGFLNEWAITTSNLTPSDWENMETWDFNMSHFRRFCRLRFNEYYEPLQLARMLQDEGAEYLQGNMWRISADKVVQIDPED